MIVVKFKDKFGRVEQYDKPFGSESSAQLFIDTVRGFSTLDIWMEVVGE